MIEDSENMGIAWIPGTFPTKKVQNRIYDDFDKWWDREKINLLYFTYKDAVLVKKLAPYPGNMGEVTPYIAKKTGYPLNDVRLFLVTILNMSKADELDKKFINPTLQKDTIVGKIEEAFRKGGTVPKTITTIKWVGVLAIVGAGLYLVRPLLAKGRK